MNIDNITYLHNKGYFTDLDIHFGRFINGLYENEDADIFLAAVLLSNAVGKGNVCLDLDSGAKNPLIEEIKGAEQVEFPESSKWLRKISKSPVVGKPGEFRPLVLDEKDRLYLFRYWDYEKKLTHAISIRVKEDIENVNFSLVKDSFNRLFPIKTGNDNLEQMLAAFIATFKKICIISGGPGTGKTYTVAKILALLLEQATKDKPTILIAAPTGKAAATIGESIQAASKTLSVDKEIIEAIPAEAFTIHRMLKPIPDSPYFYYNADNPLHADVVVVDEASMVDLAMMSKLFSAVPPHARLILIGDKDQLASVDAGAVLGDICDRSRVHGYSEGFIKKFEKITGEKYDVSMKRDVDNPGLHDCMVVLKRNYRFAYGSPIGELSRAVTVGDSERVLYWLNDKQHQICWEQMPVGDDLNLALEENIINGYAEYLKTDDPIVALRRFYRFRILCAVKMGPFGVNAVNRHAELVLSQAGLISMDTSSARPWYKYRPVLITRNDYDLGLFNGDVGITLPAPGSNSNDLFVFFSGSTGELRRFLPRELPEHETVYAMSVHKSQGSEFENILILLPDKDYPVLTREMLYTGVTRARQRVTIWGRENIIKTTIARKIERTSGLRDALWT
jgi:exodeoxyribonuclease V alpha subunit